MKIRIRGINRIALTELLCVLLTLTILISSFVILNTSCTDNKDLQNKLDQTNQALMKAESQNAWILGSSIAAVVLVLFIGIGVGSKARRDSKKKGEQMESGGER